MTAKKTAAKPAGKAPAASKVPDASKEDALNAGGAGTPATRPALRITSKQPGFRRAGMAFGTDPADVPLEDLSDDQIEQLQGESMLVCVEVEIEVAEQDAE